MRSFVQVEAFLYARLPVYQRQGAAAHLKFDLEKTIALSEALGRPHEAFPMLHVAGTNGKGSVSSMLAAALEAAGYAEVGLFTSPHLKSFTERIRINGAPAEKKWVVSFVNKHLSLIERLEPSFFELTCVMAFQYFAEKGVDIAVIEVGMGGRLDSTNIITPEIAVITNISWDHADLLGDSLAKIAAEKAGVIKAGRPVVIGEHHPETWPVFVETAERLGAPLYPAWERYAVKLLKADLQGQRFRLTSEHGVEEVFSDLPGFYQAANVVTARAAVDAFNATQPRLPISPDAFARGLSNVRALTGLRGRMEVLSAGPLVLADVAHNEAGLTAVLRQAIAETLGRLHIVLGVVQEKDLARVLPLFPQKATYYFVRPDVPRGLSAEDLQAEAAHYGLKGQTYSSCLAGYEAALAVTDPFDTVLVTGSLFVVAEVL